MSQAVMNELVNMSQEIIKLKDEKYELVAALKSLLNYENLGAYERSDVRKQARAAIAKAEGGAA